MSEFNRSSHLNLSYSSDKITLISNPLIEATHLLPTEVTPLVIFFFVN
jgi:hypothetical protein